MASGHLNLPPHLVPWQQHGVDYILSDDVLPLELSICHDQQNTPQQKMGQAAPRPTNNVRPTNPSPSNAARPDSIARPSSAPQHKSQASNTQSTNVPFLPAEHWPSPWQELIPKTIAAPVVWTYFTLGDDLTGKANPERRDFLRKLLTDLGHPKGTHTFWPAALATNENTEPTPHAQAFWSGVNMLKSRAVVAMGQAATKALGLDPTIRPFMQTRHNGCFVVVLRDVDFLISEPQHYANVREFLRSSLAPFAKR